MATGAAPTIWPAGHAHATGEKDLIFQQPREPELSHVESRLGLLNSAVFGQLTKMFMNGESLYRFVMWLLAKAPTYRSRLST